MERAVSGRRPSILQIKVVGVIKQPYKLLLVSTGNISNSELEQLFMHNISTIEASFQTHDFIEFNRTTLILHS